MSNGPATEYPCRVKNSFLHFDDPQTDEPRLLFRSKSWSASSSSHSSSLSDRLNPPLTQALNNESQHRRHEVFSSSSSSSTHRKQQAAPADSESSESREQQAAPAQVHFLSVGSALHDSGKCSPCRFELRDRGCVLGKECGFCHSPDHLADGSKSKNDDRPGKGVRDGYKRKIRKIISSDIPESEKRDAFIELAAKSSYVLGLLREVVPNIDEYIDQPCSIEVPVERTSPELQTPVSVLNSWTPQIQTPGLLKKPMERTPPEIQTPSIVVDSRSSKEAPQKLPTPGFVSSNGSQSSNAAQLKFSKISL